MGMKRLTQQITEIQVIAAKCHFCLSVIVLKIHFNYFLGLNAQMLFGFWDGNHCLWQSGNTKGLKLCKRQKLIQSDIIM